MGKSGGNGPTTNDPTAPSRSERRKAETTTAILDAAERRFMEGGYADARIEDIAADADVAIGSIYVHFGSKQGLYLALIERAIEVEESYLVEAFDPAVPAPQRLVESGIAYLHFFRDHPVYFRLLAFPQFEAPNSRRSHPVGQRVAELGQRQVERLAATIAEGVAEGSFAPVDPERAALFLWGAWQGVIALNLRPGRPRVEDHDLEAVLGEGRALLGAGFLSRTEKTGAT